MTTRFLLAVLISLLLVAAVRDPIERHVPLQLTPVSVIVLVGIYGAVALLPWMILGWLIRKKKRSQS
jgi:hypothetical protein